MADINLMRRPMPLLRPGRTDRKSPLSYFRMHNEQARLKEHGREFAILGHIDPDDVGFRSIYVMGGKHWYLVEVLSYLESAIRLTRTLGDATSENHRVHFQRQLRKVHLDESMARLTGMTGYEVSLLRAYRVPPKSEFVSGGEYSTSARPDDRIEPTPEDLELNDERGRANQAALREEIVRNGGMVR